MTKVFIDGSAGTTGLRIADRLAARHDISLITLADDVRKDVNARKDAINGADIVFLCLPDDAARESVGLAENSNTKIIDTSTAHRTDSNWVYGFPELAGQREKIVKSNRIANPGCHASGFVALIAPLVQAGLLNKELALQCFSLTGYSGGGKKMIAQYEASDADPLLEGPRQYALTQQHKHLKEMSALCGLERNPIFCPIVGNFYSGMEVTVPLFRENINGDIGDIRKVYQNYYQNGLVRYEDTTEDGFLSASAYAGKDNMGVSVFGNEDRILLVSRFDNLGKGASGAAIQNMNILMGISEDSGLNI